MDYSKLSPIQFKLASMLAYYSLRLYYIEKTESVKEALAGIYAAEHACHLAEIDGVTTFAIRGGKFKGLQNLSKLSGVVLFESDYDFSESAYQKKSEASLLAA